MAARVFIESSDVEGSSVRITGPAARHLDGPLRARPGELIVVVEDSRLEHGVQLKEVNRDTVLGDVVWSRPATGEPALRVHVVQAITQRGMDEAVEAMAQLGAASIRPVTTRRTVRRLDADAAQRRQSRWNAIAREAAQLAGRARAPEVLPPVALEDALTRLPNGAEIVVATLDAERPLSQRRTSSPEVVLAIGPEGGLDPDEVRRLRAADAEEVHLGARVLPAHLAGTIALSLVLANAGDLDAPTAPAPKI
ncbi:MAG TPA: RsmE family RNA methyltransferase [Candidatus Dormibacteraeota bacterium]|nr:RsmE family RNA methyltransferase [Candidatus Dormibacteraeota bacterium]